MKYLVVFNSGGENFSKNKDGVEMAFSQLVDASSKDEAIKKCWDTCEMYPDYDYMINVYEVSKNWFGLIDCENAALPMYSLKAGK